MTTRRLLAEAGGLVASVVIFAWLLLGCGDNLIPSDGSVDDASDAHPYGWDPDISECCEWFRNPLQNDRPQVCLDKHTDVHELQETQCRYLHCLGDVFTYWACRCDGELRDERCPQ